jgi:hypothetical protein
MKRKLIDYDSFEKIKSESLTNVQAELEAAGEMLAETLGFDDLSVNSYGAQGVLFESGEGEFVKADYRIGNGFVQFDNVEQVVLNEAAESEKAREIVSKMIDSLIESDDVAASERLVEWFDLPRSKRILNEGLQKRKKLVRKTVKGEIKYVAAKKGFQNTKRKGRKQTRAEVMARMIGKKKAMARRSSGERARLKAMREKIKLMNKNMKEWNILAENVLNFVDYNVNGPSLDCPVLRKEGEIVSVRVPTMKIRNEAKILRFDWKTMNTDVVIKRNSGKKLAENSEFAKSVIELKRLNALSDSKAFEESVERAASNFPSVIYLTESELARVVKSVLEGARASNFDDETCGFLAEAMLRTVHENYVDTVAKIVKLAGAKINDKAADTYAEFKTVAENFYSNLDEQAELEMQAFVDVYEALRNIHETAKAEGEAQVADLVGVQLDGLLPIVMGKAEMDFDVLGEAAEWLYELVESENWGDETPVVRADGQHPDLIKKGKQTPYESERPGSTPDAHHTSDGKDYSGEAAKELSNNGWSNIGGEGVYPSLDNPYVPKADMPKIVGEKDVDSDSDQLAHWGDNDTWPSLQNPYCKPSITPKEAK